jgi:hypothetical protein
MIFVSFAVARHHVHEIQFAKLAHRGRGCQRRLAKLLLLGGGLSLRHRCRQLVAFQARSFQAQGRVFP